MVVGRDPEPVELGDGGIVGRVQLLDCDQHPPTVVAWSPWRQSVFPVICVGCAGSSHPEQIVTR